MQAVGWAALGALAGVWLEWAALRVAGESGPACSSCGAQEVGPGGSALLRAWARRGLRCAGCGSLSPLWLASLAPVLAIVFGVLALHWQAGWGLMLTSVYAASLVLIAVLDLRHRLVYPLVTYPATALAVVCTPLLLRQPVWSGLAGAALGAGLFLALFLMARRMYGGRSALGFGDVMIAGLVGAIAGLPGVLQALTMGMLFGGLGAVLVGLASRSRRASFAYGPALCLGSLLSLLGQSG